MSKKNVRNAVTLPQYRANQQTMQMIIIPNIWNRPQSPAQTDSVILFSHR